MSFTDDKAMTHQSYNRKFWAAATQGQRLDALRSVGTYTVVATKYLALNWADLPAGLQHVLLCGPSYGPPRPRYAPTPGDRELAARRYAAARDAVH